MSYLTPEASTAQYGVVEVGGNINVANGVISIPQSVASNASPTFGNVTVTGNVIINGNSAVSSVIPTAGNGISITNLVSSGPNVTYTINNTGVDSIIAGNGIVISPVSGTGNVTISANVGFTLLNTALVTGNYTATATDEYIGVSSANLVVITLPTGINGREYIVKDEFGSGFGTIDVVGTGGQTIDSSSNYFLLVPLSSASFVFRGTGWHVI
jgi:hypothetical protein